MKMEGPAEKDPYSEAFRHPEKLEIEGGTVEIVDLRPEKYKTQIPLVIEPGWLANVETWEKTAKLLVKEGRRIIVVAAPHGVQTDTESEEIPMAEMRKAAAFTRVLDAKQIEQTDVLTHSEGGIFMTAAALEQPERIRALLYDAPVGLVGKDNFWKLAFRFFSDVIKEASEIKQGRGGEERKEQRKTGQVAGARAMFSWPEKSLPGISHFKGGLQSLKEVMAIAQVQTQKNIQALHEKGVKIYIMHPVDDKASPITRLTGIPAYDDQGHLIEENGKIKMESVGTLSSDMVDGFLSVGDPTQTGEISGSHNAIFLTPNKYAAAIDALLDTAEKNIEREKAQSIEKI